MRLQYSSGLFNQHFDDGETYYVDSIAYNRARLLSVTLLQFVFCLLSAPQNKNLPFHNLNLNHSNIYRAFKELILYFHWFANEYSNFHPKTDRYFRLRKYQKLYAADNCKAMVATNMEKLPD